MMSAPGASDVLAWARLPAVTTTIQTLYGAAASANTDIFMYLERVPMSVLSEHERQEGIRLERYEPTWTFDQWERGRVFDATSECKWERFGSHIHLVYCGPQPPDGFAIIPDAAQTWRDQDYYLWGERVSDVDKQTLGLPLHEPAFVELQIPRILRYPVSLSAERVCLKVREFYTKTGQLWYARWCSVFEVP
jgi:hypothetical protein